MCAIPSKRLSSAAKATDGPTRTESFSGQNCKWRVMTWLPSKRRFGCVNQKAHQHTPCSRLLLCRWWEEEGAPSTTLRQGGRLLARYQYGQGTGSCPTYSRILWRSCGRPAPRSSDIIHAWTLSGQGLQSSVPVVQIHPGRRFQVEAWVFDMTPWKGGGTWGGARTGTKRAARSPPSRWQSWQATNNPEARGRKAVQGGGIVPGKQSFHGFHVHLHVKMAPS